MADNFAQTVKDQADIVKIIGDYVKLRKTGAQNYTGLCPFHKEKTGSFSVNAIHRYFYCFGCHEKGDVFTFVMKMDTLSFPEAVRVVATKAGIPLPKRDFSSPGEAREAGIRKQLVDLHEGATQYFEAQLKSPPAARAREYLSGRGVTPEILAKFRIGYAPDDFNDMRERLLPHFNDEVLRQSGLFTSSEKSDEGAPTGPLYARFRKRITFPIANEAGKPIAFTARALDEVDDKGRTIAKYMNSPETMLYSKGSVLFNLDKAKADMRSHDFALLVEGQMDCISVYMAGVKNVLAVSGTAFTEAQVRMISRFTKRVVVNFDPDTAGTTAAEKSISLLTEEGFEVRVVTLEGGLDPDRFVRENGIKAYMAALHTAKRHSDYLIERARAMFPGRTADAKNNAMNFLLPHIRRSPNAIFRAEFTDDAIQKLQIDSQTFRDELKKAAAQRLQSIPQRRAEPASERERVLLRALVLPESDPARQQAAIELQQHPEWIEGLPAGPLLESLANAPVPQNPLDAAPDDSSRTMLAEVLAAQTDPEARANEQQSRTEEQPMTEQVANALLSLHERQLKNRQEALRKEMAEAERRGDTALVDRLTAENMAVNKMLREL